MNPSSKINNVRLKVAAANFRLFRVRRHTDMRFVFAPTFGSQAFGLFFCGFGIFIASAVVWMCLAIWTKAALEPLVVQVAFFAMLPFAIAINGFLSYFALSSGMMLLSQTVAFDKLAGTVTRRWAFKTVYMHRLHDVVTIQFLDAGWVRIQFKFGGGRGSSCKVHQFQLNLVLTTPTDSRLNVCAEPDESFVRSAARELAAFLGVHLIEHTMSDGAEGK